LLTALRVYSKDDSPSYTHIILSDVEGKSLAEMRVADEFISFVFDLDGTILHVQKDHRSLGRWRISPAPSPDHESSIDDNKNDHSSLPMVFVPIHDETQQQSTPSISPAIAQPQYKFSWGGGWIKDKQERQVLWIPPDLRGPSDCYDKKVVIGSDTGNVTIVHFSDDNSRHSI
jgi:hypothetical protein